jgi:YD repeat-containing protein
MNIGVPRYLIVGLAGLFSAYHVVLAIYSLSLQIPMHDGPIYIAMALYAVATIVSLLPIGPSRMPIWNAVLNVGVAVALPLLVTGELIPTANNGYGTWYVAAIGTLMVITSTRRRHTFAWIGLGFLVAQTVVWGGVQELVTIGVIGSFIWVGISHVLSNGLASAVRDAQRFARAEREATDWQAAQEAHVFERQFRLDQTSMMALAMLRTIEKKNGDLTEEERQECLHLEGAIRDEIRGRKLLNDAVRKQVMRARRRGATVTLLDEGGIDDLPDEELDRALNQLAAAIAKTDGDKVIARTVPEGSDVAITVVGLRTVGDGSASALGQDSLDDDEVDLWLEIPRRSATRATSLAPRG